MGQFTLTVISVIGEVTFKF